MLQRIHVITGFRACGKSKIGEILLAALNNSPKVRVVEMSDAIKYFLARPQMSLGKEIQQYRNIMDSGGVIPDGHLIYMISLGYLKIKDHEDGRTTEDLVLPGGFRTRAEALCFNQCNVPVTVMHIVGDYDDMLTGVQRRINAGVIRTDSMSLPNLERGWHDYREHVIPALQLVPKDQYHEIHFRMKMRDKINACIKAMPFPAPVKAKMKRRILSGNHNACIKIEALDNPPEQSAHHKLPHAAHLAPPHAKPVEQPKNVIHVRIHPVPSRTAKTVVGLGLIS